jgi:hypothetical protein
MREVGPVREVDREPVPAAAADRDEVAPLVVEPGLAGHVDGVPSTVDRPSASIAVRE